MLRTGSGGAVRKGGARGGLELGDCGPSRRAPRPGHRLRTSRRGPGRLPVHFVAKGPETQVRSAQVCLPRSTETPRARLARLALLCGTGAWLRKGFRSEEGAAGVEAGLPMARPARGSHWTGLLSSVTGLAEPRGAPVRGSGLSVGSQTNSCMGSTDSGRSPKDVPRGDKGDGLYGTRQGTVPCAEGPPWQAQSRRLCRTQPNTVTLILSSISSCQLSLILTLPGYLCKHFLGRRCCFRPSPDISLPCFNVPKV